MKTSKESKARKVAYLEPEILARALLNNAQAKDENKREKITIIDVRGNDFEGGNIPGCLNIPSGGFPDEVASLAKAHKNQGWVVFHCMYSQQRGPRAASIFTAHLNGSHSDATCQVYLLRNGFGGWLQRYLGSKNEKLLLENVSNWTRTMGKI